MLNFSKDNLPEGTTDEVISLLNSEAIQGVIKTSFDSNFEIQASGLKKTNEALKAEKLKLKEYADTLSGIDVDEYKKLQESAKNKGKESQELERVMAEFNAVKDSRDSEITKANERATQFEKQLKDEQLKTFAGKAIAEYNATSPLKVTAGAEKYIIDAALNSFTRSDDGSFVPMDGERILTGADGIMSGSEWVNSMRDKEPLFFDKPTGSGAMGSAKGAGGSHYSPSDMAGDSAARTKAIAAKFNLG